MAMPSSSHQLFEPCPFPWTNAPLCNQTYADAFGSEYTNYWAAQTVITLATALLVFWRAAVVFRSQHHWSPFASFRNLMLWYAILGVLMLLAKISDPLGWSNQLPLVVIQLLLAGAVNAVLSAFIFFSYSVMCIYDSVTFGHVVTRANKRSMYLANVVIWIQSIILAALSVPVGPFWVCLLIQFSFFGLGIVGPLILSLRYGFGLIRSLREASTFVQSLPMPNRRSASRISPTTPPTSRDTPAAAETSVSAVAPTPPQEASLTGPAIPVIVESPSGPATDNDRRPSGTESTQASFTALKPPPDHLGLPSQTVNSTSESSSRNGSNVLDDLHEPVARQRHIKRAHANDNAGERAALLKHLLRLFLVMQICAVIGIAVIVWILVDVSREQRDYAAGRIPIPSTTQLTQQTLVLVAQCLSYLVILIGFGRRAARR
ncbi:hypothetical protein CAOG_04668 [Capsaspora owczarzaki ATCC 30864]|uniref:Uncharacterized protein n=1 Tax=Capsaspora owczarzaki (strain ATCC 30864) TaxID=595528 RepID=A0A0D2X3A3_CAPO3|nr:hypothetical protein CAOG_04668 [Capsaspora owczarzaki ATCC 30864]KJE93959.1 hypothetical protein CAOG_004668 [Capsaspora owczarzaki ATCC 30864]|eukprot:XP_004347415.1 hypothetical protein CAOG_04668 [Capsaspora owczarzaki ATCC 30864]